MNSICQRNLVAKLKKSGVDQVTKARLSGIKQPLEQVVKYAESLNMSIMSPSAPSVMKTNVGGFAERMNSALAAKLQESKATMGNDTKGRKLYAEVQTIIKRDMDRIAARMNSEVELYAESMLAGSYVPFQLAILPHVYLETIAATSRFLMPTKEYVSEQVPPRRLLVRQLKVDGQTYDFPNCLKDPEVMRKLYSAGSEAIEFKLDNTGAGGKIPSVFNIFTVSGVGVAGQDTLVPVLDVVKIKYTDAGLATDTEEVLPIEHTDNAANNYTRGRIYKSHKSIKTGATDEVFVAGDVEFSTGNVKLHASDSIKEITFRAYKSGAYNRSFASIDIDTKPIIQTIKQRLNLIFDYDPGDMINFLSLENIDGILEGQSIIFEVVTAAKDQYAYDKLEEGYQEAKRLEALGIDLEKTYYGVWEKDYYEIPGANTGVLPGSIDQWTRDEIGRNMREIHTEIDHRFRSTSGMQYNWYGSPVTVAKFVPSDVIISKNENYGGMVTDYEVFGVEVSGKLAKVVSTERVTTDKGLRCIPFSEMDAQPTYEFQQAQHALFTDGTLRHPTRPHMPAVAYYDYFDCNWIFAMFGQINMKAGARP